MSIFLAEIASFAPSHGPFRRVWRGNGAISGEKPQEEQRYVVNGRPEPDHESRHPAAQPRTGCYRGITSPSQAKKPIRDKLCRHRCRVAANVFKPFSITELDAAVHTWQPRRRPQPTKRHSEAFPGTDRDAPAVGQRSRRRTHRLPDADFPPGPPRK
ncbi:hypothetical protein TcasGA2_TC002706 [Tribolium castaneum]|uniref:Uncharacterized protein n=1 Tax=Tribolium castaneum TaxID=7070 RepID=D6WDV1_TRICA|nr:hypothetical protein TcasGA2_TC002706 [Tribolium castaneum]